MKLFSQRQGLSTIRPSLQSENVDQPLRNGIWNTLSNNYWDKLSEAAKNHSQYAPNLPSYTKGGTFIHGIWADYFKVPTDLVPSDWSKVYAHLRKYFLECSWFAVYDFIEFVANTFPYEESTARFLAECNSIMEREMSAYRFVGKTIVQLTSDQEIAEIEKALDVPSSLNPVKAHLQSALEKMADRKAPDYRNSIKESISAVESLCNLIKGTKTTLGDALKEFKDLHPALRDSFIKLYGYTSDAQGIRHALLDESNLDFEDAKFMLVSCSAFINYLVSRSTRQGVKL